MGAGGGKWQRLLQLRSGWHPKDKTWLGAPLPEAKWSKATVSTVDLALAEQRKSGCSVSSCAAQPPPTSKAPSRLELMRQRVVAKEQAASEHLSGASTPEVDSNWGLCVGKSSSCVSKLEAIRQRVKEKELPALGVPHNSG